MGYLLVDLNLVTISGLQRQTAANRISFLTEELCRHLILNSIREVVHKFKRDYGNVIICCDSKKYWRRDVFPHYKAGRKKLREKSTLDWDLIFSVLNETKEDLKTIFPYKVVEVEGAEADDVIGTLVPRLAANEPVLIVSSDGDFKQLHQYGRVKQYNPMLGIYVKSPNPQLELKEKILTGDKGDGIPSCLSNDDVFVLGIRQKPLSAKRKAELIIQDFNNPLIDHYRNISRNKLLIDLTMTPLELKTKIVEEYDGEHLGSKRLLLDYFMEKKLFKLMEFLDEF